MLYSLVCRKVWSPFFSLKKCTKFVNCHSEHTDYTLKREPDARKAATLVNYMPIWPEVLNAHNRCNLLFPPLNPQLVPSLSVLLLTHHWIIQSLQNLLLALKHHHLYSNCAFETHPCYVRTGLTNLTEGIWWSDHDTRSLWMFRWAWRPFLFEFW